MGSLANDYSMPSELIEDIQNMQVNDSFQLVNSFLDVSSNLDINSQLYDHTFEYEDKKEDTMELLEADYSKELKNLKPDISGDTTNKMNAPRVRVNESGQKTNSYFNYIQKLHHSRVVPDKQEGLNESFGLIGEINRSDSFHYKPSYKTKDSHVHANSVNKRKNNVQQNIDIDDKQEKQIDRSLSLPKFDTFNACPQIKQTAYFSENLQRPEEIKPAVQNTPVQESLQWEGDNIEINQASKVIKDDSLADSFLLEIAKSAKSQEVAKPKLPQRSKTRKVNLLKASDFKYAKPT